MAQLLTQSRKLNQNLSQSGLVPILLRRLAEGGSHAASRVTLIKMLRCVYEHHPRPKTLVVEHNLSGALQRLASRDTQRGNSHVIVQQMAGDLLRALTVNELV